MDWYPLRLSFRVRLLVFGGRAIAGRLGKKGLPDWPVAETWEVSDVDGYVAEVRNGPLAGTSLRQLTRDHRRARRRPLASGIHVLHVISCGNEA